MNQLLRETHKKENINILRARDYYFDKARFLHRLDMLFKTTPVLIAVLSYMPPLVSKWAFLNSKRDFIVGISTIVFWIICHFIEKSIDGKILFSNMLREEYDCNVFNLPRNPFLYDFHSSILSDESIKKKISGIPNIKPKISNKNYEVWYGDILSANSSRNILCFQMDNVIYTYYIYIAYRKILHCFRFLLSVWVLLLLYYSFRVWSNMSAFILVVLALFNLFQTLFEMIMRTNSLIERNKKIMDSIMDKENIGLIKKDIDKDNSFLRNLQDIIAQNRNDSLFVPKIVRDYYLNEKNNNPYIRNLNKVKTVYFEEFPASFPSDSQEIEVLSSKSGEVTASLNVIQKRLLDLLSTIGDILSQNGIPYTLDGGTLIGAVRESGNISISQIGGKFIFWDDDIDIGVRFADLERIKNVLSDSLPPQYELQDYSDKYYSPRLSNLRIREKSAFSVICENDSPLYEKYKSRGLFVDVYAYTPTLKILSLDKIWRRLLIHPLNKKILKTENKCISSKPMNRKRYEKAFLAQKKLYLKRVDWYVRHAKSKDYCCYTPNYLDNIKKAGPYVKYESIFGNCKYAEFEGRIFPIPSNPENVLISFYGEKWYISPYVNKETLIEKHGNQWYGEKTIKCTVLKHYKYLDRLEPIS